MFCSTKWSSVLCEEAAERLWKTECYPGRENLYLLTLNPVRTQYHSGLSKDWVFLGWLRRVSHVSASFRHELCKVLWAHTIVDTEGYEEPEDDCEIYRNYREEKENTILRDFKTFLTERPAILRGIKGFSIELSISRPQNLNKYDKFFEWCDYIAEKLELKSAWFKIALSERDLQEYVHGKEDGLHDLAATSRLRVSDYFGLELSRLYDENGSSVDDWDEPLDPKYQTALLAVMKPFSLRSQVKDPTTEEGKYLQARVEEFGETDKVEETRETEELKSTKADVEIEENQ
jgi:hypothetical protein